MRWLRGWIIRLAGLTNRRRRERAFEAELESHLELHIEEQVARGVTPAAARRQAILALGGVQAARESYRDRGGIPALDSLGQDIRFAGRMLRKTPGFTAAAVAILALGIGANTAVFSLINAVLIRPINGGALDGELIGVYSGDRTRPDRYRMFSYPEYVDIRDRTDVFAGLLAETSLRAGLDEGGRVRRVSAALVSSNYFRVLGVEPVAGRGFTAAEEHPGSGAAVAIVSYNYWRERGLRPDVIGSRISISGRAITIVGVAPEHFHGSMPVMSTDIWLPFGAPPATSVDDGIGLARGVDDDRSTSTLLLLGTLKPGVTATAAEARLAPLANALAAAYPQTNKDQRLVVQAPSRTARGPQPRSDTPARFGATALMAIAGLVLFVACLNLANMLLARGGARRQEIAVRLALGGGRLRIVRQLVVEGLALASMGGVAALAVSWWIAAWFMTTLGDIMQTTTIALDVSPDLRVVAIVALAAVASTIIFSLGPAWRLSKPELATAMKPSAPVAHTRTGLVPLPSVLVAIQIALSLALLVGAGVFMRSGARAASSDPGFALGGGIVAALEPQLLGLTQPQVRDAYAEVLTRVRALPGVREASMASIVPFGNRSEGRLVRRDAGDSDETPVFATLTIIGTRYFSSVGLPIIAGRDFTAGEERDALAPVAIVDRLFVDRLLGGGNPIGRIVHTTNWDDTPAESVQIVGVVPTVRDDMMAAPDRPHLYVPFGRQYHAEMTLHVRVASGSETSMLGPVGEAIHRVNERLPIVTLRTLTGHRDASESLWAVGFAARLFAAFGLIALALVTVGIYGLRAYVVSRRAREIGIRMALGATQRSVVRLLLHESAGIAAAGLIAGLVFAFGLVQVVEQSGMLFEVNPLDPLTFSIVPLILVTVTAIASYIPARRAMRIDPAVALRPE